MESYEKSLDPAISWLAERGIPESVARTFRLGFVDEPERGHEQAQGRLAIPFVTPSGVVDIRFRSIDGREPKYLSSPGSRPHLYNVPALHAGADSVVLCEGELDTVVMHGLCGVPAVGVAGVNSWKPHFRRVFDDYATVWIVMDPDDAGRQAAGRLRKELPQGRVVDLPADVNDTFLERGPEFIRERLGL